MVTVKHRRQSVSVRSSQRNNAVTIHAHGSGRSRVWMRSKTYRTTGRVTVKAALAYLTGRQEQAAEQLQHRLQSCALLEYERISRAIFPTGLLVPTYREHTCAHGRARAPLPPAAPADTSASPPVALNGNWNSTIATAPLPGHRPLCRPPAWGRGPQRRQRGAATFAPAARA